MWKQRHCGAFALFCPLRTESTVLKQVATVFTQETPIVVHNLYMYFIWWCTAKKFQRRSHLLKQYIYVPYVRKILSGFLKCCRLDLKYKKVQIEILLFWCLFYNANIMKYHFIPPQIELIISLVFYAILYAWLRKFSVCNTLH